MPQRWKLMYSGSLEVLFFRRYSNAVVFISPFS